MNLTCTVKTYNMSALKCSIVMSFSIIKIKQNLITYWYENTLLDLMNINY